MAYYLSHMKLDDGQPVYDQVWGIDHDWEGDIGARGDQLAEFINAKLSGSGDKADIFAHSQGTLVTRYALEISGGNPATKVDRAFLVAPMNEGIPITMDDGARLLGSFIGFGYKGVKEMLRSPF